MSENQIFKQRLKQLVKDYLEIDDQIATLQKAIKERKDKKEKMSKVILEAMKDKEIAQMNLNETKLVYSVTQTKNPLNKVYLNNVLTTFFNDEKQAEKTINYILENRTKVEKVKLKRVNEKKKKGITLNE
tara:strand:+ start:817 stop:1206 length:390 start_codon:yes stop_codon:yes gene_type:complete